MIIIFYTVVFTLIFTTSFYIDRNKKQNGEIERLKAIMKNKQTKKYEITARLTINKESLIKWLEDNGIIQGFSNLW